MVTEYTQGEGQSSPQKKYPHITINPNANGQIIAGQVGASQVGAGVAYGGQIHVAPNTNPNYIQGPMGPVGPMGSPGISPEEVQRIKDELRDAKTQIITERGRGLYNETRLNDLIIATEKAADLIEELAKSFQKLGEAVAVLMQDKERRDRMEALDDEQFRKEIETP